MNEKKIFYVYGYIRLDTNTYFYIGKGKNNRWRSNQRNNWFKKIMNKWPSVRICIYTKFETEVFLFGIKEANYKKSKE